MILLPGIQVPSAISLPSLLLAVAKQQNMKWVEGLYIAVGLHEKKELERVTNGGNSPSRQKSPKGVTDATCPQIQNGVG
jgi:hypothetical protein